MVRIIIIILLSVQFCYSQISNSQFYFGRGLDSAAILNSDIADSSILFRKLIYVNGPKLIGNPSSTYDSLKCIKLGTNLSFSNDTLNAATSIQDSSIIFKKLHYVNGPRLVGNPTATYDSLKYIKLGTNLSFSNDTLNAASSGGGGGSGDVNQNGNSYGATMIIGTNDNNTFEIETNGISRFGITSGATTGGLISSNIITTNTSTLENVFTIKNNSTGTVSNGFGSKFLLQGKSTTTNSRDMAEISTYWTTATDASREAAISFKLGNNGGALQEVLKLDRSTVDAQLTLGNVHPLTISTRDFIVSESFLIQNTADAGISITAEMVTASPAVKINGGTGDSPNTSNVLGDQYFYNETGTKKDFRFLSNFISETGTGKFYNASIEPYIDQSAGGTGITGGLLIEPTLSDVVDFRAIEIKNNENNSYGIYQDGSSTKNIFVGKTRFGSTASPTALLNLAAGTATANTAPLKFTSGTNLTTPEAGAVEYDASNLYITNGSAIRFTIAKMLSGSATLDFGSTASGTSDDLTITVTGAADGDEVILGVPNAAMNANASYFAWVSASNTIKIRHNNYSTGSINPASATFKVSVIKR
ncbi:MAG: hypothetical protein IT265_07020 [Saprospiraceae bacterium]|nr:hypothetical protein [Saprospiraceae bacterium]